MIKSIVSSCVPVALAAFMLLGCNGTGARTGAFVPRATEDEPADIILAWNARAIEIGEAEDHLLTLKSVRTAAMMHLAMHDGLNTIDHRFARYAYRGQQMDADPIATTAQAAYEVVVNQYPDRRETLDDALATDLDSVTDGSAKSRGIALGRACAVAILRERARDEWNAEVEYSVHPMAPGVYAEFCEHSDTPEGFVFGAGWGKAQPFFLPQPSHFRAPPPPPIDSGDYTEAYEEVKEVGRFESPTRTEDQTHLALWWKDFVEDSHNRLARELAQLEDAELWQAARMFALLNASVFDAYVNVFENKFFHNHWRPYTAIRWAENDGNPDTQADPSWTNTHDHTYAFPSYPSAHGTACAAAMTILGRTFGDEHAFTMEASEVDSAGPGSPKVAMDPPTRSFDRFSAAATECGLSRLYLGIHFRYDSVEGVVLGTRIGDYAWANFLRPE